MALEVRIINNTSETLMIIEKTCWYYINSGTWSEDDVLKIGGSGTMSILWIKVLSSHIFSIISDLSDLLDLCYLLIIHYLD
ncbi:hypothetical protein DPV78_012799 [Talaromyces pinophilus]|nr:hypothetical protein DPV78_012799 [Talaromyces pinophilus]